MSRSAAYRLRPSTCASRSAALPSSRSILRYQWIEPEVVADPAEGEQPGVGVGLVGEPPEHHRQQGALDRRPPRSPRGQGLQVAHRAGGVAEAEGGEPLAGLLGDRLVSSLLSRAAAASSGR
jgi:hypothetical protein